MLKQKKKPIAFRKLFLLIIILLFVVSGNNLQADTVVYIEYNPIEEAYYRIIEVDGIIVSEIKVDKDGVDQ